MRWLTVLIGYGLLLCQSVCSYFGEMPIDVTAVLYVSYFSKLLNWESKSHPDNAMLFFDWLFSSYILFIWLAGAWQGLLNSGGPTWFLPVPLLLKNSRATWWVLSGNFSALRNTCEQVEMRVWDLRALRVSHADYCSFSQVANNIPANSN